MPRWSTASLRQRPIPDSSRSRDDRRALLEEMYRAAVAAADPVLVTHALLQELSAPNPDAPVWIFGAGKAVNGMASAVIDWLGPAARKRTAGLLVSVSRASPDSHLEQLAGDHPIPGEASFLAAHRLEELTELVRPGDQVYVLLSGGATSLIGAPVTGVTREDYRAVFDLLLGSGLDIAGMNAIRKQISRWGAGRLTSAVAPAAVQPLIISDVESNDPATIASGPCTADPVGAAGALDILREHRLLERLPASVRGHLIQAAIREAKTPERRDFAHVAAPRIASNALAVDAAANFARKRGLRVIQSSRLSGEAAAAGRGLASLLLDEAGRVTRETVLITGGETTVTLAGDSGIGGRCQELALMVAERLAEKPHHPIMLLVAGTDGRDGPTDAAGAVVDGSTWNAIVAAGRDPARDLERHDSHPALDAAGALLRTGPSGTNMMDVAFAIL